MNYFFTRVVNRLGFLKKINIAVPRRFNKSSVVVPVINGLGADNLSLSELWMCSLLEKVLPLKKGVFLDVGVNIGQTLMKLKSVNSNIEYIGFEPNPVCVYYAGELIKANGYTNTRLLPVGIFNEDCVLQLNMYSEGDTDPAASIINNFRPGEKIYHKIFVQVSRFETVSGLLGINDIAIVKIDVEGAELEVLQSLENTLLLHRPFIFIEILPCYTESNTARIKRQAQLEELLTRLHYQIFRVIKKDHHTIQELKLLSSIGIHGSMDLCEYVMAPEEFSPQVASLFNSK
jgi:FkbM family methyltransferase